jgi:4'-phosphopantetheinyl transferase
MQLHSPTPSEFPQLLPGQIHVWAVPLTEAETHLETCDALLSRDERIRAEKFAITPPRVTYTASRAALRTIIAEYLAMKPTAVNIVYDALGKPQLADAALSFNVAHSSDLTLIAVARAGQLGVDVERVRNVEASREIAERNFHPEELAAIRAAAGPELTNAFLRCWTRKEAILKCIGIGLGYPLESFNALAAAEIELAAVDSHAASHLWLHDLAPCDDYRAALAANFASPLPQGFTFTLDRLACSV